MELIKQKSGYYSEVCSVNEIREEVSEIIVPDTSLDFVSEIYTFSTCTMHEKSLLSGNIRTSGDLHIHLHYAAEGSENGYSVSGVFPFSQTFDTPDASPNDKLILSVTPLGSTCEVLNSRKVRIRTRVLAKGCVIHFEERETVEDICGENGEGINTLVEQSEQTYCAAYADKQIAFTEEIRLAEENTDDKTVRWEAEWQQTDVKIMSDKVMVRGNVELKVVSASPLDWSVRETKYSIPFSQTAECELTESDEAEVRFAPAKSLLSKLRKEDGSCFLVFDAAAEMSVLVYRKSAVKLLSDAYSTEYDTEVRTNKVYVGSALTDFREETHAEQKIEHDGELSASDISVKAYACLSRDTVECRYCVRMLVKGESGTVESLTVLLSSELPAPEGLIRNSLSLKAESVSLRSDAAGTFVSVSGILTGKKQTFRCFDNVCDCKMDKSRKRCRTCKGNLVIRAVGKNESAWSIAKQYGTTRNAVLSANEAYGDGEISEGRLVIIPFVR